MYVNVIDTYKCVYIYIPMNAYEIYEHGLMAIPQYGKKVTHLLSTGKVPHIKGLPCGPVINHPHFHRASESKFLALVVVNEPSFFIQTIWD